MHLHRIICIVRNGDSKHKSSLKIEADVSTLQTLRMPTSPRNAACPMIAVHGLLLSNTMTTLKITICTLDAETRKGISLNQEMSNILNIEHVPRSVLVRRRQRKQGHLATGQIQSPFSLRKAQFVT